MSLSRVGQKIKQTTEIYSLVGFREENPISTDNFEIIIDEYELENEEVHCCQLNKHGTLCHQKHKHGYIARLKDQTLTIIGNHCVITHLDTDSNIRRSISLFKNEREAKIKLAALNEVMDKEQMLQRQLQESMQKSNDLEKHVLGIIDQLGEINSKRLSDLAKSSSQLKVRATFIEKGETKEDDTKTFVVYNIGVLNGIRMFDLSNYARFKAKYQKIQRAFNAAHNVVNLVQAGSKPNMVKANESLADLRNIEGLITDVEQLNQNRETFFKNQLSLLCFLSSNKGERFKAAKYVLNLQKNNTTDRKKFVLDADLAFKSFYQADSIIVVDN